MVELQNKYHLHLNTLSQYLFIITESQPNYEVMQGWYFVLWFRCSTTDLRMTLPCTTCTTVKISQTEQHAHCKNNNVNKLLVCLMFLLPHLFTIIYFSVVKLKFNSRNTRREPKWFTGAATVNTTDYIYVAL